MANNGKKLFNGNNGNGFSYDGNIGTGGKKSKDDYRSSSNKDRPIKIEVTSSSNSGNGDSTNGGDQQPSSANGFQVPGLDNPYVQRVVDMSKKVITNVEQVRTWTIKRSFYIRF